MNDAYDLAVTYITLRLGVFSKALSGISLIRFPSRNLKKKIQSNLHLIFFQPVNKKYSLIIINSLKKIVHLRRGWVNLYFSAILYGGL